MRLLVVIVNYGTAQHVLGSLESLVPQLRELGDSAAWIVDNHSPDDSLAVLHAGIAARGHGDVVRVIASPDNRGYGAGNNLAIRQALELPAPPEYIHVLNPDATPDAGAERTLVEFLERRPDVGIAGGLLRDEQGRLQCSTFRFPSLASEVEGYLRLGIVTRLLRNRTLYMDPPPERSGPVDWVSGASFVVRASVLQSVGLFDETYFLYFEELDLCRRVAAAGHGIHFVREASICHLHGVTTGMSSREQRVPSYWMASREHYYRKVHGRAGLLLFNLVAASCFALHRVRQFLGRQQPEMPHFLRDFVRYSFLGRRHDAPRAPQR